MSLTIDGLDFDIRDFENKDEDIKQLAETLDELIEILKFQLKNL